MSENEEWLEVVNEQGEVQRMATRQECHSGPGLIHRVVHVLVWDQEGRLYLQKRAQHKDIQPGKWDTSVGGHLCPGETIQDGALRELEEELHVPKTALTHLYQYMMFGSRETELVNTYSLVWGGPITPDAHEIEEGRFWTQAEIEAGLGQGIFTPNFEDEYARYLEWKAKHP